MSSHDDGLDLRVKVALYRRFAETGRRPSVDQVAADVGAGAEAVLAAYRRLFAKRVLVLDGDGSSIRMAPPFSGVPTQHVVESNGIRYFANCAWDALGVPVALHQSATVRSRCGESNEPLTLEVGPQGPGPSTWVFHCLVPAAHWWDDIVFT
ncbi:MAG TPA: organomercurial lyase [Candidatus Eisenbacteria bacterium]|nr:organomercurial lyase [Candidatus Eisenbacteria bacterium]